MNNSQVHIIEEQPEQESLSDKLRSEESRILTIIGALQEVQSSKGWSTLKTEVFDNLVNILERNIRNETKSEGMNIEKINRLVGELKWAEQYSDLNKLENTYKIQLQGIRKNLYGKQSE